MRTTLVRASSSSLGNGMRSFEKYPLKETNLYILH